MIKKNTTSINYRVDKDILRAFVDMCKKEGYSVSRKLEILMQESTDKPT